MKVAIVTFPGSNATESLHALQDTGIGDGELVWHTATDLSPYDVIIVPGGFSYGDYLRSGAIASHAPVIEALRQANQAEKLIIGFGNGFQVLTEARLLPGVLRQNDSLKFHCTLSTIKVVNHQTPYTIKYQPLQNITLPIAHESGNYYCDNETLAQLQSNNQIVFTYEGDNPNGSTANIAGIINERGNVCGMMPRPERAINRLFGSDDGKHLFESLLMTWRERHDTAIGG